MPQCSVCQVRYVESNSQPCPVCNWDGRSLSLVTGLIPEVNEREAVRLAWAKNLWSMSRQRQEKLLQLQIQRDEALVQVQQIQDQLTQANQKNLTLSETLQQQEATIAHLQSQLEEMMCRVASAAEPAPVEAEFDLTHAAPSPLQERLKVEVSEDEPDGVQPAVTPPLEKTLTPLLLEQVPFREVVFPSAEPSRCPPRLWFHSSPEIGLPRHSEPQQFTFEVVTLQPEGVQRQCHTATGFSQFLGEGVRLEMVLLPGGSFCMGSPETEAEREGNEGPQHTVMVPPFCISKFPITQAQWRAIAALPKIKQSLSLYPANFEGDDRPVEQVSWYDAIEFCARLSQQTGQTYRLPSEAEWEYACRAGTTTPFHFGHTILPDLANYDGNYAYCLGSQGNYRQETTPVGAFAVANAFGLYDMHGNIWEWCADCWHPNYEGAPADGSIWESEERGNYQVLRGGAWYCLPGLCRSAQRHWNQPDMGGSGIGFRVVCLL